MTEDLTQTGLRKERGWISSYQWKIMISFIHRAQKLSLTIGSYWFCSSGAAHAQAPNPTWQPDGFVEGCSRALTAAGLWERSGSSKSPKGHSIGWAWVTWPSMNQSLWSVVKYTDWLQPRSHAAVLEPGGEITAQWGRELVLPKQTQKPSNGCCMGGKNKATTTIISNLPMKKLELRDGK